MTDKNEPAAPVSRHAALIKLGVASLVLLLLMAGFKGYRDLSYVKGQEAALAGKIDGHPETDPRASRTASSGSATTRRRSSRSPARSSPGCATATW